MNRPILFLAAAIFMFCGCDTTDPIYSTDHPEKGTLTLSTEWSATNLPGIPAEGYTLVLGDFRDMVKVNPAPIDHYFEPGAYNACLYTVGAKITVSDAGENTAAIVETVEAPRDPADPASPLPGIFIAQDPGFLYSGSADIEIEKSRQHTLTVPMRQQVRELTLVIRPEGDAANEITSIASSLGGVAATWNLLSDTPHGEAVGVAPEFERTPTGEWKATIRLLGINGPEQKLEGAIVFNPGTRLDPIPFAKNLHQTEGFTAFNSDKKTPMVLEAHLVKVNRRLELGEFAPVEGWTGGEQNVPAEVILEAGQLETYITAAGLNNATQLTIKGSIDKRDFDFMRDRMPNLSILDLSNVTIAEYTDPGDGAVYPADGIPAYAFFANTYPGNRTLTKISFPDGLTSIGAEAFYDCKGLTGKLTLPSTLKSIGPHAFSDCKGFTGDLIIPDAVVSIGQSAFRWCEGFNGILYLGKSLVSIEEFAFDGCSGFNGKLVIPHGLKSIGFKSFYVCSGLEGLEIGDGIESIGDTAFGHCTGLRGKLIISGSATSIGGGAFRGCSGLESLEIGNGVKSIDGSAFFGCTGLENLKMEEGLQSISNSAFSGCTGLSGKLIIPGSVRVIGIDAFKDCAGFEQLSIGDGVESIGEGAFSDCINLSRIDVYWTDPLDYVSNILPSDKDIHIPQGTTVAYDARGWPMGFLKERN